MAVGVAGADLDHGQRAGAGARAGPQALVLAAVVGDLQHLHGRSGSAPVDVALGVGRAGNVEAP